MLAPSPTFAGVGNLRLSGRPCLVHAFNPSTLEMVSLVLTGLYSKFQDSLGYGRRFTLCSSD